MRKSRRWVVLAVLAVVGVVAAGACSRPPTSPPDTPDSTAAAAATTRAGPAAATAPESVGSFRPEAPAPRRWRTGELSVLWEQPVPFATGLGATSERVFVFAGNDIVAVDPTSGAAVWRYGAPPLTPSARLLGCACAQGGTLIGDRLYTVARGDTVVGLDPTTGEPRWSQTVGQAVASPPLERAGAIVIVAADASGFFLTALDSATGAPRWETRPAAPIFPVLAARGDLVVAPLAGGGAAAFTIERGQLAWSNPDPRFQDPFGPSQLGDDILLLRGTDAVVAMDTTTGAIRWQARLPSWPTVVAATREHAYVGLSNGQLSAFDARSGELRWTADLTPGFYSDALLPAAQGVFVLTLDGRLVALDTPTGQLRWQERIPGGFRAPTIIEGALILPTLDGEVHVLDPETGAPFAVASVPGPVILPPVGSPDRLFIAADGASGGVLVALGLTTIGDAEAGAR